MNFTYLLPKEGTQKENKFLSPQNIPPGSGLQGKSKFKKTHLPSLCVYKVLLKDSFCSLSCLLHTAHVLNKLV